MPVRKGEIHVVYPSLDAATAAWKLRQRDFILANIGEMTLLFGGTYPNHDKEPVKTLLSTLGEAAAQLEKEAITLANPAIESSI